MARKLLHPLRSTLTQGKQLRPRDAGQHRGCGSVRRDEGRLVGLGRLRELPVHRQWKLSFRAEIIDDKDGYRTGIVQKWKEATLTLAWLPTKPSELRGEIRRDRSNAASFLDTDGVTGRNSMNSYGLQFLYKF